MPKITGSRCPVCRANLDGATSPQDVSAQPSSGDVSVCMYCGVKLVFADNLALRLLTAAEERDLPQELRLELAKIVMAVNKVMGSRN